MLQSSSFGHIQLAEAFGDIALAVVPPLLFLLVLALLFRRSLAKAAAFRNADGINYPGGGICRHGALTKFYFRAIGTYAANTAGRIGKYSRQHRQFLSSGSVCPQCGESLLNKAWMPLVHCLDAVGNRVPLTQAQARGFEFECPNCHHRWPIRKQIQS